MSKRRIAPTTVPNRYLFKRYDNVFSDATLTFLRSTYAHLASIVTKQLQAARDHPARINTKNKCVVYRDGRVDATLTSYNLAPLPRRIHDDVVNNMDKSTEVTVAGDVRALIVPSAVWAQPEHEDFGVEHFGNPQYVTLLVALEDVQLSMGPTAFRVYPGVDGLLPEDLVNNPTQDDLVKPLLRANQALAFDGRIRHYGSASTEARVPILYYVFKRVDLVDVNVQ